jgi:hypothetical protein
LLFLQNYLMLQLRNYIGYLILVCFFTLSIIFLYRVVIAAILLLISLSDLVMTNGHGI